MNHDPPVRLGKTDLAAELAKKMVSEFDRVKNDEAGLADLYARRPALSFVINRIILGRSMPGSRRLTRRA